MFHFGTHLALGPPCGRLGGVLGRLGCALGASLGVLGRPGCVLEAPWGVFGVSWRGLCRVPGRPCQVGGRPSPAAVHARQYSVDQLKILIPAGVFHQTGKKTLWLQSGWGGDRRSAATAPFIYTERTVLQPQRFVW